MAFLASSLRKREQSGGAVSQLIRIVHETVLNDSYLPKPQPSGSFAASVRPIAAGLIRAQL